MVDVIDLQYATMISNRLNKFKIKSSSPYKINFRCPVCGDSQKSREKARGWLLEDPTKQTFHYWCHNCGISLSFRDFLSAVDPSLQTEYLTAKYIDRARNSAPQPTVDSSAFSTKTKETFNDPLRLLKKISQLAPTHPVKKYIEQRQIPPSAHFKMYYAPKFMTWINKSLPGKFPKPIPDHPRLVLPFIDKAGTCFGVSGRGFDPDGLRYMSIMFQDRPKIFGLDQVNFNKPYSVLEGGIDSLFLSNAVAMAGADGGVDGLEKLDNATFVFDAEPRNKEICKRMDKLIKTGRKVCIWPPDIPGKDVNEMVLAGLTPSQIEYIIKTNTYSGLNATLKLNQWKRV